MAGEHVERVSVRVLGRRDDGIKSVVLVLYFDSRDVYRYAAVPPAVHQRLLKAGAKVDQVFNTEIRGKYKYQHAR